MPAAAARLGSHIALEALDLQNTVIENAPRGLPPFRARTESLAPPKISGNHQPGSCTKDVPATAR